MSASRLGAVTQVGLLLAAVLGATPAIAADSIDLKAGETIDLGPLFWVTNCRSQLKGTPTAEVMEGPPELSVTVKDQKVLARKFNCATPVAGGELLLTATKDIKTRTQGKMFLRIKYQTRDGDRQNSREIDYTLFPGPSAAQAAPAPAAPPTPAPAAPAKAP